MNISPEATVSPSLVVNCVAAPVFNNLTHELINDSLETGVHVVGVTAQESWGDTAETVENLQLVKEVVRTHGRAYILQNKSDMADPRNRDKLGVVMGFQNPKPIGDSPGLLAAFLDMGLRCLSFAMKDNSYLGGGHASAIDSGLTPFGRDVVKMLNDRGALIDLSHSGDRTAWEATELSCHPVVFSHSIARSWVAKKPEGYSIPFGIKNSPSKRAAPDELIKAVAAKGGVICTEGRASSLQEYMDQVDHLVQLVGPNHVGVAAQDDWVRSEKDMIKARRYQPGFISDYKFGSEYVIRRIPGALGPKLLYPDNLRADMRKRGYDEAAIAGILGGNMVRVMSAVLPD